MTTEHPVTRVVRLITTGHQDAISRWDVMNNVRKIVAVLVDKDLYNEEIENYLYDLHDSAKDSL